MLKDIERNANTRIPANSTSCGRNSSELCGTSAGTAEQIVPAAAPTTKVETSMRLLNADVSELSICSDRVSFACCDSCCKCVCMRACICSLCQDAFGLSLRTEGEATRTRTSRARRIRLASPRGNLAILHSSSELASCSCEVACQAGPVLLVDHI